MLLSKLLRKLAELSMKQRYGSHLLYVHSAAMQSSPSTSNLNPKRDNLHFRVSRAHKRDEVRVVCSTILPDRPKGCEANMMLLGKTQSRIRTRNARTKPHKVWGLYISTYRETTIGTWSSFLGCSHLLFVLLFFSWMLDGRQAA